MTMVLTEVDAELETRVRRGVEYLDAHEPGWRARVDWDRLDISHAGWCVLGQVFGDFWEYMNRFMLSNMWARDHGFTLATGFDREMIMAQGGTLAALQKLTDTWKRLAR